MRNNLENCYNSVVDSFTDKEKRTAGFCSELFAKKTKILFDIITRTDYWLYLTEGKHCSSFTGQ